ncbi:MAG: YdcF family protein [Bacteroidota bacterium]
MTTPTDRSLSPWRLAIKAGGALVGVAVAVAGMWFMGFLWFVATLPSRVEDVTTRTDAIVVLTGGSERLTTGIALLHDGLAGRLFISGVHRGVDVADILKAARSEHPDLAGAIVLGHAADDTVGNASETARWVAQEGVGSLRLVTGAYHMPRSLVEFRHALPGVAIVPHPVFPDTVKSREWWRWPGTAALLATEYSKYLAAEIRQWFLPRKPAP